MVPTTQGRVLEVETQLAHTRAALTEALAIIEVLREALWGGEPKGPFAYPSAHDYVADVLAEMRSRR